MKTCYKCETEKELSEFAKNSAKPDGLQAQCRECQAEYRRQHYLKNKKKVIDRVKSRKADIVEYVQDIKRAARCKDCGEDNYIVLEFDHLDDKDSNVSEMAWGGYSKERIDQEIAKCEIVCANCHRVRTHTRRYS